MRTEAINKIIAAALFSLSLLPPAFADDVFSMPTTAPLAEDLPPGQTVDDGNLVFINEPKGPEPKGPSQRGQARLIC